MKKTVEIKEIKISEIQPEEKDLERADDLRFRKAFGRIVFNGDNSPFESEASKQAKLIKDPEKLVRRTLAVLAIYGENSEVAKIFLNKCFEFGFSYEQRNQIKDFGYKLSKSR